MNNNNEKTLEEKMQAMMGNPQQNAVVNAQEENAENSEEIPFAIDFDDEEEQIQNLMQNLMPNNNQQEQNVNEENNDPALPQNNNEDNNDEQSFHYVPEDQFVYHTPTHSINQDEEDKKEVLSKQSINKSKSPDSPEK